MRSSTVALAVLACAGIGAPSSAAAAEEIYSMAKFSLCKLPGHPFEYISVTASTAFSGDGSRVAIASDKRTVHVCETAGNLITSIAVPSALAEDDEYVNYVALNGDGTRLATASRDKMLRLWDVSTASELASLAHPNPIFFAAFSPDGSRLASSVGDGKLWLWEAPEGREIAVLEHAARVASAAFSADSTRLAAPTVDGTVQLWSGADGSKIATLSGHTAPVYEAAFSPDGMQLVTASEDATARTWDAGDGTGISILRHTSPVVSAAFSADGTKIVTGAGNEAHVFDAALGREVAVLKGHEFDVNDAAFNLAGTRIATASSDHSVCVWDSASGEAVAVLPWSLGSATFAAFTPDGERIVSLGGPSGLAWTRIPHGSLPQSAAGVWFTDFGSPDQPLPDEIVREVCLFSPVTVATDGLVVFLEHYGDPEPPRAIMHLRCASESNCMIFAEAPAQGLELQGEGSVTFTGDKGEACLAGECRPIALCPKIEWTDDERASGFAERWETAVLGQAK